MHETPGPDSGDLDALRDEVDALREENRDLKEGLRVVADVVGRLAGQVSLSPGSGDELATRRARKARRGRHGIAMPFLGLGALLRHLLARWRVMTMAARAHALLTSLP